MIPHRGCARSARDKKRIITAGALGLILLTGTVGRVQAGLLEALFGGARAPAPPAYDLPPLTIYPDDRAPRRAAPQRDKAEPPLLEMAPLRQFSTCCKHGEDPMRALLADDTLMRGDVVMTPKGLRVFMGSRPPHHPRDFVPVGKSSVATTHRRQLLALDR